jgi:putative ABC transport system permease protein
MNLFRTISQALVNLRANKLRSLLTMLGVIIGVSSVILLVSLVDGARSSVQGELEKLGSNLIIIAFDRSDKEVKKSARKIEGLTLEDAAAIRAECNLVGLLCSESGLGAGGIARFGEREANVQASGTEPDYLYLFNQPLARGRFLTRADLDDWNKVCVIGETVRRKLFPASANVNPIGQDIELNGVTVTIVGVLSARGKILGQETDNVVLLPATTVQKRLSGNPILNSITAQPRPGVPVNRAMEQIWQCLMRRHENAPGFVVDSQETILSTLNRITAIFGVLISGGAGLSLLVGGIGIMNIMLVSVTERTREIGLRKAVGARRRDILTQFLVEAATLSGLGGLIGIGLGAGTAYLISFASRQFLPNSPLGGAGIAAHVPLAAVVGAFAFSAGVGVFFGIYPAFRAAQMDPITALRHE